MALFALTEKLLIGTVHVHMRRLMRKPTMWFFTLSNVDAGETAPTPVTTVLSLQNLMDANKFLVLFNVI